jgi:ribosomal-protein-alanine N-acetyltransferase
LAEPAPGFIRETARVILRHFTLADVDALAPIMARPEMNRYSYRGPLSRDETLAMLERFLNRYRRDGTGPYALLLKPGLKLIGYAGLPVQEVDGVRELEVGYGIDPGYWGQGLASEAACAARDHAFETLGRDRLISIVRKENVQSVKVAGRMGMHLEKETLFYGAPVQVYAISRETWASHRPRS